MTLWNDALSLLDQKGWTKGRSEDEAGRICLGQAINKAFDDRWDRWDCRGKVTNFYSEVNETFQYIEHRLGGDSVTQWNDSPERTWSDVETLLWDLHLECKEGQE